MKRFHAFSVAAICIASACSAAAADSLTMADFGHSVKLMVDGYTGSETLADFPVLVRLAEYDESTGKGIEGFRYSDLTNGKGNDIAFFDALGNHLASEIETNSWTTSGESTIWVLLPKMKRGTKFFMCYNTSESGAWVTNGNPWGDYVGVWHMDEKGGVNKPVFDSTTNALHGVTAATGKPSVVPAGKVGRARHIATDANNNPGTDSGITVDIAGDAAKRAAVDGLGAEFTASMWVRVTANYNYYYLVSRKNADGYRAWGVQTQNDALGTTRI